MFWMVVLTVMCQWRRAHCGVGWVLGWWWVCGCGCFLRLLSFGSVGRLAMCEWWLTHCGVAGGLRGYVRVAAGTLQARRGVWWVGQRCVDGFAVRVTADAVANLSCTTMPRSSGMTGAALLRLLCGLSRWMGWRTPTSASCWIRQSQIQNRRPSMLILMLTQLLRISPFPTPTQPPRMPLRSPTPAMTRLPRVTDRSYRNR